VYRTELHKRALQWERTTAYLAPGNACGSQGTGGPVLLVGSDFPIVGVVTEHWYIDGAEMELLEFATLEDVLLKETA
jgi:hypothetical protein